MKNKKIMAIAGAVCLGIATSASAAIVANGDFETTVTELSGYGNGDSGFALNTTTFNIEVVVGTNPGETPAKVNEWVWPDLTKVPAYSETGGKDGGGGFIQSGDEPNGKARGTLQHADDGQATTGLVDVSIDVFFNEASGSELSLYVELYAWNSGDTSPALSLGGGTSDSTDYNVTTLNGASTLLTNQVFASNVTPSTWTTISLADNLDLGTGNDYYSWRIGVVGEDTDGDIFAFDNVTVIPEPATLGMIAVMGGGLIFIRRRLMM